MKKWQYSNTKSDAFATLERQLTKLARFLKDNFIQLLSFNFNNKSYSRIYLRPQGYKYCLGKIISKIKINIRETPFALNFNKL